MRALDKLDLQKTLETWFLRNQDHIKTFLTIFIINIFIFGQKIFFLSFSADDYGRFYSGGGELASWLGRWAAGWLNQNVFTGALHILPYLYQLVGVFSFTLAGYLTALLLNRSKKYEIAMVTLLTSATPMVAYNLYYNTNITAWLATLAGVVGFYLFRRFETWMKWVGLLLVICSIGCYQTITQVLLAISMLQFSLGVIQSKNRNELKFHCMDFIYGVGFVTLGFACSMLINHLYIQFNHLEVAERLKTASETTEFSIYYSRLSKMFHNNFGFMFFRDQIVFLYRSMALMGLIGAIFCILVSQQKRDHKLLSSLIILLLFLSTPLVINLPNLTGHIIPLRAHYTIGWFMAGFFTIQSIAFRKIFRNLTFITTLAIISTSVLYINLFYDAGTRQTQDDLIRVNQIISRIRMHPNYVKEPVKFKIIGQKGFAVLGWNSDQQALYLEWPRYNIFKNFTDLKFEKMDDDTYTSIETELVSKGGQIESYPGKDSIYVKNGNVVLFLDNQSINDRIMLGKIKKMKPALKSSFDLYLHENSIVYFKSPCSQNDLIHSFYLHVYPKNSEKLPNEEDHMKMYFQSNATIVNNECVVTQELPDFPIRQINTGQFSNEFNEKENKPYTIYWKSTLLFN